MMSTSDLRKGAAIELDGELWQILDYHHIKMGRGSAQVRITLRNIKRGQTVDRSFQAGTKWPRASMEKRPVQFLYRDGDDHHFMDTDTYDQFVLTTEQLGDTAPYLKDGMTLDRTSYQGETIGVELPITVDLKIVASEPGFAGDTQSGAKKPATLETGLVVQVPLFINEGHDPDRHANGRVPDPSLMADGADPAGGPPVARDTREIGATPATRILGVGEAARAIQSAIRADDRLRDLWIEGEVGRVTVSSAGHAYFTLKDERAQLQCVWFRDDRIRSTFQPQAGLRVVVHGRIDYYEPQGALQVYVETLQPAGMGDLTLRFEALKAQLDAEGLFATARKRPLPSRPATIAVITSPTGAVWRDVIHVLDRRWPLARVVLVACRVQGEDAPASIIAAFRRLDRYIAETRSSGAPGESPAVTILARGGGSMEDLWAFNDERVVRAVVAHPVPVVTGIGHEVDVTLADFAADVRAPTPSAAAELVTPDRAEYIGSLRRALDRLGASGGRATANAALVLSAERRALDRLHPAVSLATARERIGLLLDRATGTQRTRLDRDAATVRRAADRLPALIAARTADGRGRLEALASALAVLGPQATLERGYAIVRRRSDGAVVRQPAQAPAATLLTIRVSGGELDATVDHGDAVPDDRGS